MLKRMSYERALLLVTIETTLFFAACYFILGPQRLFFTMLAPFGPTTFTLFGLVLYFTALYWTVFSLSKSKRSAARSLTRLYLPFTFPFIAITFLSDLATFLPQTSSEPLSIPVQIAIYSGVMLLLTLGILLALPPTAIAIWRSPPLNDPYLLAICRKANFTHAGIKEWTVMENTLTAAIIGITGRFRYILFSPKLLQRSSQESLGAILAHEIGHARHHHLLLYPFILLEMICISLLAASMLFYLIGNIFDLNAIASSQTYTAALLQASAFLTFAGAMALYFRYVFGYFSRLFERQADLYPLELKLPVEHIIGALDALASASGNIHDMPNWHHYSIRQRIDFLQDTQRDPTLIGKHHRKVKISLLIFAAILIATLFLLYQLSFLIFGNEG
jgi:STE24 endopeptidase